MAKRHAKWIDYDTNTLDRDGTKLKVKTDSTLLITASLAENAITASYVDWSAVNNIPDLISSTASVVYDDSTVTSGAGSLTDALEILSASLYPASESIAGIIDGNISVPVVTSASHAVNADTASYADLSSFDHNSLGGLQGGQSGEYYHLTQAEHSNLTSGTPTFDGLTITDSASFGGDVTIDGTLTVNEIQIFETTLCY